jgi:hypothetical protein
MIPIRFLSALIAGLLQVGGTTQAAVFKCQDDGATSYQSMPCSAAGHGEPLLGQSADRGPAEGDPDRPGLWEIATSLQPRVLSPADKARPRPVASEAKTDARPARQLSCAARSPIKAWLSPLVAGRCRTEIAARSGRCVVEEDKNDGRGGQTSEVLVFAGNYHSELQVISRLTTSHGDAEPVTDEARIELVYRGECKPGMVPGDEFLAAPNGNWVKVR